MHPCSQYLFEITSVSVSSAVPQLLVVTLDWTTVRPYPSARIHLSCQGGMRRSNFSHCSSGGFTQGRLQHAKHESTRGQTLWRLFVGFAFQPEQHFQ